TLVLCAVTLFPHMLFAHNIASGCASTSDRQITGTLWTRLCQTTLSLTDGTHFCVTTASADALNPETGNTNSYLFTADTTSSPSTGTSWERTLNFNLINGIAVPSTANVSTVHYQALGAGTYTFYFLAKQGVAGEPTLTVDDYSLGVV